MSDVPQSASVIARLDLARKPNRIFPDVFREKARGARFSRPRWDKEWETDLQALTGVVSKATEEGGIHIKSQSFEAPFARS